MAKGKQVPGFDYTTGKPVSMTAGEWREKYPPQRFRRIAANGETWFTATDGERKGRTVAEAYAIIPEGK